jgi:hypothetical protein
MCSHKWLSAFALMTFAVVVSTNSTGQTRASRGTSRPIPHRRESRRDLALILTTAVLAQEIAHQICCVRDNSKLLKEAQ